MRTIKCGSVVRKFRRLSVYRSFTKVLIIEKGGADNWSFMLEGNRRVYEGKDALLWLPTSFCKSVCYEVLSFACLTVNKRSWVQGGVATPLSV